MRCPSCGAQADGAYCSACGAPLKGAQCRACQSPLSAGARFCNQCGAATGYAAKHSPRLPWIFAGVSLLILILVIALPSFRDTGAPTADTRVPIDQVDGAGASTGGPGPLTGTPREQADRLFNRIMSERESGDTAQARFFLPMAIQAYQMAGDLDGDGLYHLSLLHNFAGNPAAALSAAERVLATSPDHLLALSAAAQAARASADTAAARGYYQRLLNAYETQSKLQHPEYLDHARMLPDLRAEARSFVGAN